MHQCQQGPTTLLEFCTSKTKPLILPSRCTSLTPSPSQGMATPSFQPLEPEILSPRSHFQSSESLLGSTFKMYSEPTSPNLCLHHPAIPSLYYFSGLSQVALLLPLGPTVYTISRVRGDLLRPTSFLRSTPSSVISHSEQKPRAHNGLQDPHHLTSALSSTLPSAPAPLASNTPDTLLPQGLRFSCFLPPKYPHSSLS